MAQYEIIPHVYHELKDGNQLISIPLTNVDEYMQLKEIGFFKRVGEDQLNAPQLDAAGNIISLNLSESITFGNIRSSVLQMFVLNISGKYIPLGVTNFTLLPSTISCDTYVQVWENDIAKNYPLNEVFGVDYLLVLGWSKFIREKLTREMYPPIYHLHESSIRTFVSNLSVELVSRTGIFTSPRGRFPNSDEYVAFTKLGDGRFPHGEDLKLNTVSPYSRTTIRLAKSLNMQQVENMTFGGTAGPVYFGLANEIT